MCSIKDYRDYYSTVKTAHKKGHAEGRAEGLVEGRAEGLAEGRADVAKKLKVMGLPIGDIIKATGLSLEEIELL